MRNFKRILFNEVPKMNFLYVRKNRYCVMSDLVKGFIDHMQPKFTDYKLDKGFLSQIMILFLNSNFEWCGCQN